MSKGDLLENMEKREHERHIARIILFYYGITPSWALAVTITFLFACAAFIHIVSIAIRRTWFLIPLVVCALFEVLGYGFRATGIHERFPHASTYVASSTFLLIAPMFAAASLYQVLAQIIVASRGGSSLVWKAGIGLGFGALDVLSYGLQAGGAARLGAAPSIKAPLTSYLAKASSLILAGNIINLISILLFTAFAILSHRRSPAACGLKRLYTCLICLLIRTVFRIVVYSKGFIDPDNKNPATAPLRQSPLFREAWFYALDALPVFIILAVLAAFPPTRHSLDDGRQSASPNPSAPTGGQSTKTGPRNGSSGSRTRMELLSRP